MSPASMQAQDHYSSSESGEVEIGDRLGWLTKLGEGGERIPSAVMGCLLATKGPFNPARRDPTALTFAGTQLTSCEQPSFAGVIKVERISENDLWCGGASSTHRPQLSSVLGRLGKRQQGPRQPQLSTRPYDSGGQAPLQDSGWPSAHYPEN